MGLNPHEKQAQSMIQKWINSGYTHLFLDESGRVVPVNRHVLVRLEDNQAEELLEESISYGQEYQ